MDGWLKLAVDTGWNDENDVSFWNFELCLEKFSSTLGGGGAFSWELPKLVSR